MCFDFKAVFFHYSMKNPTKGQALSAKGLKRAISLRKQTINTTDKNSNVYFAYALSSILTITLRGRSYHYLKISPWGIGLEKYRNLPKFLPSI